MSETSSESNAAIVARLFRGTDAPLGSEWLTSVGSGWTDSSLHHLVEKTGTLRAAKTKEIYGHFRTKTQMASCEGPYWSPDPSTKVKAEATRLNDMLEDATQRLKKLRTDAVGGLLVVTSCVDDEGTSLPFITLIAAPSVATFNAVTGDSGVILEDLWDPSVLTDFLPDLTLSSIHCPLIGAQEGFSRAKSLKPSVIELLQDSQPLFFPAGELTCAQVMKDGKRCLRTIFLPEVCNLPVGMRWPVDIGLANFKSSIQGVLGSAGLVFLHVLSELEPLLTPWFDAIPQNVSSFIILSTPFLPLYDKHFPAIDTGIWPETVQDADGFSPLMDMLNGHVWRLWCDRILTTSTPMNRQFLAKYLTQGASAITAKTYLGADIPGRFCPNYAYHFPVANGWPTDTTGQAFLGEFQHAHLISPQAKQHDPVELDLHQPMVVLDPLSTREEQQSAKHKAGTPKYTYAKPPEPKRTEPLATHPVASANRADSSPMRLPTSTTQYTPSPGRGPSRESLKKKTTTKRSLDDELQASMIVKPTQTYGPGDVCKLPKFDPLLATVYTAEGRSLASDTFLNVCRLLAHHSDSRQLSVDKELLPKDSNIYVREPCGLFRREILQHLPKYSSVSGFMYQFRSFMEAILSPLQISFASVYDPNFFTGAFLHSFLSVDSWMVDDNMSPSHVPANSFHVYQLIGCLQSHKGKTMLLPLNGLSLLEAKQIGILVFYLFAQMDLQDYTFSPAKFELSILGQRIKMWSILPDSHNVHGLWSKSPLQATYQWFAALQQLLLIEQSWIKRLHYHPDNGFFHARDDADNRYLLLRSHLQSHIPGRTNSLGEALRQYDTKFEARWFGSWFMDPVWTSPIPDGHSTPAPQDKHIIQETQTEDLSQRKRLKLAGRKHNNPDFINALPPMEMIVPIPRGKSPTATMINRFQLPIPFPRLASASGTLQTICLNSAFVGTNNCCVLRLCGDRRSVPRTERLHLDMSKEPWKSRPEPYWDSMVAFLKNETVAQHVRPTRAFCQATPSAKWE
jgi:hypothetical protein